MQGLYWRPGGLDEVARFERNREDCAGCGRSLPIEELLAHAGGLLCAACLNVLAGESSTVRAGDHPQPVNVGGPTRGKSALAGALPGTSDALVTRRAALRA